MVLNLHWASESPGRLVKTRIATLKYSDLIDLRWDLRIYISNKLPGDAVTVVVWEPQSVAQLFERSSAIQRKNWKCGKLMSSGKVNVPLGN